MARSLSLDLRERVVAAVSGGMSWRQAAERFGLSVTSAVRWSARDRQAGSPAAKPRGGDRLSARIEAQKEQILMLLDGRNDITLAELQAAVRVRRPPTKCDRDGLADRLVANWEVDYRITSTGMVAIAKTSDVWLPSTTFCMPRRP